MVRDKNKIWLSHSGLDILYRCPRCFWLKYKKGILQPEGITSRLPDRFDRVIKKYFDKFRGGKDLPPLIRGKLDGVLESPFQEKYFCSINEKFGFWGKLDECLINSVGLYSPVDFKTASSDPRQKEVFPAYQNQLDEFSFLLEQNNKKTAGQGHLIYFYPDDSDGLHNGFPMILHIQTLKTSPKAVMPRLEEAIKVLEGKMPEPAKDCPFCQWYGNLSEVLKGAGYEP